MSQLNTKKLGNKLLRSFKPAISKFLTIIPVLSDYYLYYWRFPRNITACRGVFPTFSETKNVLPLNAPLGYNQSNISKSANVSKLTARRTLGELDPVDESVLPWLKSAFQESSAKVFDLGGNVGVGYFAFQKHLDYPVDLSWQVCEIPEIVKAGEQIAKETNSKNLSFTSDFNEANKSDILISCGALQYIEPSLVELLSQLKTKPKHLLINYVPFCDRESFVTLQNIGYAFTPYKIQNQHEFIDSLNREGYELIDRCEFPRTCLIPFHRELTVRTYRGFYFKYQKLDDSIN
jgi:putative methyltransferase (TIGR04325 family)